MVGISGRGSDVPEPLPAPFEVAADGAPVPSDVAAVLAEQWHAWWVESDGPDLDCDDDE